MTASQEIWHGDSRELVGSVPDGVSCIITDPPFGAAHWSRMATTPIGQQFNRPVEGDSNPEDAIKLFVEVMEPLLKKTADECEMYIFTRWDVLHMWEPAVHFLTNGVVATGFKYNMLLIWDKGGPGLGDLDGTGWGCGHELILFYKKGRRPVPRRTSAVLHVDKLPPGKISHPMEKPVALIEKLISMSTFPNELVVDPFSGSGATAVAAQRLGRRAIGIELEEQYVKSSRARLDEVVMSF
jgi:adenine-specific DNA-methyltransferase